MGKVTFEFDGIEEGKDIALTNDRYKMITALDELNDLYRALYNFKIYNDKDLIYVKSDGCVATKEDYDSAELMSGGKYYLDKDFIETRIDNILDSVRHLLY